jgi:hypothetical protein
MNEFVQAFFCASKLAGPNCGGYMKKYAVVLVACGI